MPPSKPTLNTRGSLKPNSCTWHDAHATVAALDGLPLAIELAASWVDLVPVDRLPDLLGFEKSTVQTRIAQRELLPERTCRPVLLRVPLEAELAEGGAQAQLQTAGREAPADCIRWREGARLAPSGVSVKGLELL